MHYLMCVGLDSAVIVFGCSQRLMTGRPFPTPTHTCLLAAKIISHLVCKWALQSMTFQKHECKCLVSNQSLCKLMKEQFGFVCRSFGLFANQIQCISAAQNGGKTLNYMLHRQPANLSLKIISRHNTAAAVWACHAQTRLLCHKTRLFLLPRRA